MQRNTLAAAAASAIAALVTTYSPTAGASLLNAPNWSASGPGSTAISNIASGMDLSYSYSPGFCAGCGGKTWTFSTTAATAGVLNFGWTQSDNYAYYQAHGSLSLIDETTGVSDLLNTSAGTIYSGPISGTGTLSYNAGDVIALRAYGSNFDGQGSIGGDVQLVSLPVPEPATLALFGMGLLGLCAVRRRVD